MGHAFNQTIMDGLTRYHRMLGHNTAWIPAPTTPASPPRSWWSASWTRRKSRAMTWAAKIHRKSLGVEEKSGSTITGQMRRLGASPDWSANTSPWTPSAPNR
jgi:valyl-tRNA synthetase